MVQPQTKQTTRAQANRQKCIFTLPVPWQNVGKFLLRMLFSFADEFPKNIERLDLMTHFFRDACF